MPYTKTTSTFKSSDGEHNISYSVYTPSAPAIAIVQIIHGMCEFFDRYHEFAEYLCEKGVIVCGSDHLGHGASILTADDYGFFGHENGARHLVDDVEELRLILRKRFRALPYFMLGHSMGSFILRSYIVTYKNTIDGAIISGTSGGEQPLKAAKMLTSLIIRLKGERHRSKLLKKLSMGSYNDRFKSENDSTSWLSRNLESRKAYMADERCTFTFTARGYYDLFTLLQEISDEGWAAEVPKGLPILILNGLDDPVGDYGNGPQLVANRLQDCELYELSMRNYPEMRHEVLNEIGREHVYDDIFEWLLRIREGYLEDRLGLPVYFSAEEYR